MTTREKINVSATVFTVCLVPGSFIGLLLAFDAIFSFQPEYRLPFFLRQHDEFSEIVTSPFMAIPLLVICAILIIATRSKKSA